MEKLGLRINMVLEWEDDGILWGLEGALSDGLNHILSHEKKRVFFYLLLRIKPTTQQQAAKTLLEIEWNHESLRPADWAHHDYSPTPRTETTWQTAELLRLCRGLKSAPNLSHLVLTVNWTEVLCPGPGDCEAPSALKWKHWVWETAGDACMCLHVCVWLCDFV